MSVRPTVIDLNITTFQAVIVFIDEQRHYSLLLCDYFVFSIVVHPELLFPLSELVGPRQDIEGAGRRGDRDVAAEEEVLLLRPERGLQRPCAA